MFNGTAQGFLVGPRVEKNTKRHPTVEDQVTIYANATILGGKTTVGKNSVIGGNVWLTSSIPENSIVTHSPEIKIKQNS